MTPEAFQTCISSPEAKSAIDRNIAEATALKIDSTPTLFINGHPLIGSDKFLLAQIISFSFPH
jgi:protein-disulfide isomerase